MDLPVLEHTDMSLSASGVSADSSSSTTVIGVGSASFGLSLGYADSSGAGVGARLAFASTSTSDGGRDSSLTSLSLLPYGEFVLATSERVRVGFGVTGGYWSQATSSSSTGTSDSTQSGVTFGGTVAVYGFASESFAIGGTFYALYRSGSIDQPSSSTSIDLSGYQIGVTLTFGGWLPVGASPAAQGISGESGVAAPWAQPPAQAAAPEIAHAAVSTQLALDGVTVDLAWGGGPSPESVWVRVRRIGPSPVLPACDTVVLGDGATVVIAAPRAGYETTPMGSGGEERITTLVSLAALSAWGTAAAPTLTLCSHSIGLWDQARIPLRGFVDRIATLRGGAIQAPPPPPTEELAPELQPNMFGPPPPPQ